MSLIVMKFGGSSLANFKKLDNVTKKIIDKLKPKKKNNCCCFRYGKHNR